MLDWPHAPVHRFEEGGTYILTAGTMYRKLFFSDAKRLDLLHDAVLSVASRYEINLQSWSVFANHYHLVADFPDGNLGTFVQRLHSTTAAALNALDGVRGRRVWFQYWDTMITNERSWMARMRYVLENPVRHGLVADATAYRWCSASWFEATARPSFFETVMRFPIESVKVIDSFEVPELEAGSESADRAE